MTVAVMMLTCSLMGAVLMTVLFTAGTSIGLLGRGVIFSGLLAAFFAPLLTFDRQGFWSGPLYAVYYHTLYYCFVTAYFLLMLVIFWQVFWRITVFFSTDGTFFGLFNPAETAVAIRYNLVLIAIAMVLGASALVSGMRVPGIRETLLESPKLTQPVSIVVLSDLHIHRTLPIAKLKGIVARTNALEPDLIVLPGDTIDDRVKNIGPALEILKGLKAKHGVYAVAGNHELYVGEPPSRKAIEALGIIWLNNDGTLVSPELYLAGVPYKGENTSEWDRGMAIDYMKAFGNRPAPAPYTVLLAHTPQEFKRIPEKSVDLMIAGHTHGGQILPFHWIAWWKNDYFLQGLYDVDGVNLYVSRGSGQWGPQMRFFAPSEISLIRLMPKKQQD